MVSSPTLVALHLIKPDLLIVEPNTSLSTVTSFGTLSPVSADSSIALLPSITIPSVGILSPGLTTKTSPIVTFEISTTFSVPFASIIVAVFGASFISPFRASVVFPLENDSSILPSVINVRIIAADSK